MEKNKKPEHELLLSEREPNRKNGSYYNDDYLDGVYYLLIVRYPS